MYQPWAKVVKNIKKKGVFMPTVEDTEVNIVCLGQAGFRMQFESLVIYIDPYLSHSVEFAEGPALRRQVPIWKSPHEIDDANMILITHTHMDHCDVETLGPISAASPTCKYMGPTDVGCVLAEENIALDRFICATNMWHEIGSNLRIHPVPAAHPTIEVDSCGNFQQVGYIIEYKGRRIYHAGDTSLNKVMIEAVSNFKPIDVAMLPVNECNYYRHNCGIIGNMSIREAFQFAEDINVNTLIPMHWDMFKCNSVYQEEIEIYYKLTNSPFLMLLNPSQI